MFEPPHTLQEGHPGRSAHLLGLLADLSVGEREEEEEQYFSP